MRLWEPLLWPVSRVLPRRARDLVRSPAKRVLYGPVRETPTLTTEMRQRLRRHLYPEVESLREFAGKPFATWSL